MLKTLNSDFLDWEDTLTTKKSQMVSDRILLLPNFLVAYIDFSLSKLSVQLKMKKSMFYVVFFSFYQKIKLIPCNIWYASTKLQSLLQLKLILSKCSRILRTQP